MKNIIYPLLISTLCLTACEKVLLGPEPTHTPTETFEYLWQTFDEHYGLFKVKNVDWKNTYQLFKPAINDNMSDDSLYFVLTNMLRILNDSHVQLIPTGDLPIFQSGIMDTLKVERDFHISVVKDHYITHVRSLDEGRFTLGELNANTGYIHISHMDGDYRPFIKAFDQVLDAMRDYTSLVIDIRGNQGGLDPNGQYIASRLASKERLYMKSKKRNGPESDDFTPVTSWYIRPKGEYQYTQPIALLTNRFTVSAAETFTLAMRENDQVIHVGDTTTGAFSDTYTSELPNGWAFTISVGDFRTKDNISLEGIGIAPEIVIRNAATEILAGQDKALEKAIELLE